MKAPEGFMTVYDAAKYVGCSPATIRNYYRKGLISIQRQGLQQVIIPVSELDRIKNGELAEELMNARKTIPDN